MNENCSRLNDKELDGVAGGAGASGIGWKTVKGLRSSELAMRTQPGFDYSNMMKGCGLSNGDKVQVVGAPVVGSDGNRYVQVFSPGSGQTGYVNMAFLD